MQFFSTYYSSPIGTILLQGSDDGIEAINFMDNNDVAVAYEPNNHPLVQQCTNQLDEYFAGERKIFDFPIAQNGTVFQVKIWNLLCHIPYGKTISYMDLAKQFGDVKAIRAVAAANGKNHLAIVVPCHRVIGSNAKLTGYAGGLWRKQWLLNHEAKYHSGVQTFSFA